MGAPAARVHRARRRKSHRISEHGLAQRAHRHQPVLAALSAAEQLGFAGGGQDLAQGIDRGDATRRRFTDRILFLDGFPNMQVLDPLRIGQNVKEIIVSDLAAELGARALYQEAATYCHSVKDYVSRDLFESLMKDEEHHIDFLETQLDLIQRIGLELYTQKHVGGLESEH